MPGSNNINVVELILKKRNGGVLTAGEIASLIGGYTDGKVPDYQVAAFLMAAFLNGMNEDEMIALTECMLYSGEVLDLSDIPGIKVDKHSTGGVGDKVSIVLAPLVAACGVPVPMISGRGLGHTGGTLDKLESIPGFSTQMSIKSYRRQLADIGVVMIGQTAEIAPADKKLYALRDVTGTVEFIPFIAASIMSKKLAEGIDALVLDVKYGSGAFMQEESKARQLAETLADLGERFGKPTVALLTDMDQPLGRKIGNWPEIAESVECLNGVGPDDLMEVTMALASEMIVAGGRATSLDEALELAGGAIESGAALQKMLEMVERQGGDVECILSTEKRNAEGAQEVVRAERSGTISRIDARVVGRAGIALGAGRMKMDDVIDPLAGISLSVRHGDYVQAGDEIARIHASTANRFKATSAMIVQAFELAEGAEKPVTRLRDRYSNGRWMNP